MSGLFFQNDESGYGESFGEGMSTSMEFENKTATEYDRLSTKLALRRLLYRMERYEDLTVLQNDGNDHCQSWQSLLVRAQLCQSLWQNVAAENVDEGSDPQLRKEYMELSQRVDAACKRAQFLADQARERESTLGTDQDLVGKLFFSHPVSDDESEAAQGEGAMPNEEGQSDQGGDYYDEFEDSSDDEAARETPSRQHKTNSNNKATPNLQDLQKAQREQIEKAIAMMAKQMKESTQGIRKTIQKQNANTLNELENVAEQNMEDVSKVASNVKEHVVANQKSSWATWTTMILILGVFGFTLVTIFTIPKHPDANLGRILSGANESGPYARLLQKTIHKVQSVFGNGEPKEQTTEIDEHQEDKNWEDYEIPQDEDTSDVQERLNQLVRDMQSGGRKTQQEKQQEKLKQQEQQKQEQEERLRKLREELQEKERLRQQEKLQEEKRQEDEKLRQQKLEEEKRQREEKVRKQNEELEKRQKEAQERREKIRQKKLQEQERMKRLKLEEEEKLKLQKLEEEQRDTEKDVFNEDAEDPAWDDAKEPEEEPKPATENTSADDILASLKTRQQDPMEDNSDVEPEKVEEDGTVEPFKPPQLDREGVAAKMVSPRDFRLAAASNDLETLERYLEMAPQHINRQDKHGWTALHMAVHGNHERIVALLLDQTHDKKDMADLNIDPFVKSYEEKRTALDLALEQFGLEHPITEAFFNSGWYDRSEYKDWGDDEARLRKQKLEEHEARIAKEKEAIKAKEAKYAAAAEEERRIKKDKLDKLFGTPIEEEEDDEFDQETLQERRNRLDALLGEL